ncbi:MAG: hypothetical protein GY870_19580 [archaeon]|nr:hypothetical protein [archaeon]
MVNKKLIALIIAVVAVVGTGGGIYYISTLLSDGGDGGNPPGDPLQGLPTGTVPTASLRLDNGTILEISLNEIVTLIDNENITLVEYDLVLNEGETDEETISIKGFNPLDLYDYIGWYYVDEVNFLSKEDNFNYTFSFKDFSLQDGNYYRYSTTDATIVGIAMSSETEKKWLSTYDGDKYGNFSLFGEVLTGKQRIKKLTNVTKESEVLINVTRYVMNSGVLKDQSSMGYIGYNNISSILGVNYTSYDWGYDDNAGWGYKNATYNGTTITSIANEFSIPSVYNVTFLPLDNYGGSQYNETEMEYGVNRLMVNDPEEPASPEGKQAMLFHLKDDEVLTHEDGPFRIIIPGESKGKYTKNVAEIRFYINE